MMHNLLSPANKKSERQANSRIGSRIVVGITVVVDIAHVRRVVRGSSGEPPVAPNLFGK